MRSVGVTNVSKNRQVRRAVSRKSLVSASDVSGFPATRGGKLAQRATAGEANHSAAKGAASGNAPRSDSQATKIAAAAMTRCAGHAPIKAEKIEPWTHRRLGGGDPFQQIAAGDEETLQGARDRVAHQPGLMRQERDDERRTTQGEP